MRERFAFFFLAVGLLLFTSGCATFFSAAPGSVLSGYVVDSGSGAPVNGTRVTVHGLSTSFTATTVTNMHGQFQLRVEPDLYQVDIIKNGYSGSRVIGVDAHSPTSIEIIQRQPFNPLWSINPPDIHLEGVSEGDKFKGEIPYRVEVTGDNDTQSIYVAIGKTPGSSFITAPRQFFSQTPITGDQKTDPAAFGATGSTTFEVVVYDMNNNRTHLIHRITVIPPQGLVSPAIDLHAIAVTLAKQVQFFGLTGSAAPGNANIYVQLDWTMSSSATITGYRLYHSFDGITFEPFANVGPKQFSYKDADPRIAVGRPASYYITAVRGAEESDPTETKTVTPLATWDVRLISPSNESKEVSLKPIFRWEPTRKVSPYQLYAAVFRDTLLNSNSTWLTPEPPKFLTNRTDYAWNEDGQYDGTPWETLQPDRIYEWELVYAVAVDDLDHPTAVSVAINTLGLDDKRFPIDPIGIGSTDNFSFTTGER
ncbi:carboxypeptidase regulatory-like domain-containing protein [Candidatus Acetothermia bacterium]|nr:carboxypeptidase regulatory-like domain-containing protein [Candidatus Acetothermia bacterium]MBI3643192.1 carboxypeptidase regulatory-like domain-containing protein [Candidatus Acetothermia bacterium]